MNRSVLFVVGCVTAALAVAAAVSMRGRRSLSPAAASPDAQVAVVAPGAGPTPAAAAPLPVSTSTSTSSTVTVPPATVAAEFARAYLGAPAEGRRAACRPYDTDALDAQLGAATWAGPGQSQPSATQAAATVTLRTLNAAEVTRGGIGYEISATVTGGAGGASSSPQVLQVWVSQVAAGVWRADVAPAPAES